MISTKNIIRLEILILLFLVISISFESAIPVSGDWTEDFSTGKLSGWEVWGEDYNTGDTVETEDTWEIDDDTLLSTGSIDKMKFNIACRQIAISEGSWSFDHYWPEISLDSAYPYQLIVTSVFLGQKTDRRGTNFWTDPGFVGFELDLRRGSNLVRNDAVFLSVNELPTSSYSNLSYFDDFGERGWENYKIVRDSQITIYLDDVEILSLPDTSIVGKLDYFCISSMFGGFAKFDNFSVSADPSITFDEDSDDDNFPMELIFAGVAIIAIAIAGIIGYRYLKQKS